jgi:hypothetical protein
MNWFFWFLMVVALVLVFLIFSFAYKPIGKLFYRLYKDAKDAIVNYDNLVEQNKTKDKKGD